MRTLRRKTLQLDPQFISMITPDLSYREILNFDSHISIIYYTSHHREKRLSTIYALCECTEVYHGIIKFGINYHLSWLVTVTIF